MNQSEPKVIFEHQDLFGNRRRIVAHHAAGIDRQ